MQHARSFAPTYAVDLPDLGGAPPVRIERMGAEERTIIERFAAGAWELREEACSIYESWADRFDPTSIHHLRFMSEIVEPTDLGKRMTYRSNLIEITGIA